MKLSLAVFLVGLCGSSVSPVIAGPATQPVAPMVRSLDLAPVSPGDLGILRYNTRISVPARCWLVLTCRVYVNGRLDADRSKRFYEARSEAWTQDASLGVWDPDVLNPQPSQNLKLLGVCDGLGPKQWLEVRGKGSSLYKPGEKPEVRVGDDVRVSELLVGVTGVTTLPRDEAKAELRVTLDARLEPLGPDDDDVPPGGGHWDFSKKTLDIE